jgi:predicted dehydrogenase
LGRHEKSAARGRSDLGEESKMAENTRRDFIKQSALGTAAMFVYPPASVLGANDRVRVAMIGVGGRGEELLKQVLRVPNAQLVMIADVYSHRREEAKQLAPGIQTVDDHRRLLDMKDIDGVIVASPLHIHARHFQDALAAGKDLYSEKTMTWSIAEAEQCLAAAQKSDRVVQIGLQHESSGSLADTRKWVKDGLAGKITQVESWMSRNTPHGKPQWVRQVPSDCTAQNVDWKAFLNGRPDRPFDAFKFINWRLYWEFSGGNVTENMVHQIAWIMSALELPEPSAAYMSGGVFSEKDGREVPDTIAVTLEYPTDIVITWQSSFNNSRYGLGERLLGSDGTIEHIAGATDMVSGKSDETIRYYPEKVNRPHGEGLTGQTPNQDHMANWVDCVRTRKTPNAPVEIGYRSALAAHMANLSYRKKTRLTLEEARAIQPDF